MKGVGIRKRLRRFAAEDGSLTVEAVIWIPFFLLFIVLIVDTVSVLNYKSKALRLIHDANRARSIEYYETATRVETELGTRLAAIGPTPFVETNDAATAPGGGTAVRTLVRVPGKDVMYFGLLSWFSDFDLTFTHIHMVET